MSAGTQADARLDDYWPAGWQGALGFQLNLLTHNPHQIHVTFAANCNYMQTLQSMGMKAAFGPDADFSKLSDSPLVVTGVLQSVSVCVSQDLHILLAGLKDDKAGWWWVLCVA